MMTEKNTVILDVYEYNRLRDFEKEINADNAYSCYSINNRHYILLTVNNAIKKLTKDNKDLKELNDELHNKLFHPPVTKELTIDEIKKMSFWKLLIWYFKK